MLKIKKREPTTLKEKVERDISKTLNERAETNIKKIDWMVIMNVKLERFNTAFVEKISEIIHNDIKDSDINMVTITDAKITSDLSYAKIYFTTLEDDKKKVAETLNKASGFIKSCL